MKTSLRFTLFLTFIFGIIAEDPALNWKEGKLEPQKDEGYGMKAEAEARALDEDLPEYQDLQAEETDEIQIEIEEPMEIEHESMKEPEIAITGTTFLKLLKANFLRSIQKVF